MTVDSQEHPRSRWIVFGATAVAIGVAAALAHRLAWTCDDAWISFRYARNLVEGHGLVFNTTERVEGYTNFLWTVWAAVGIALGRAPDAWANATSLPLYALSIGLLGHEHLRRRREFGLGAVVTLPVAAFAGALVHEWQVWATGGLETSMVTSLLLLGFVLATRVDATTLWRIAAGLALAGAATTRPDAILPAFLIGLYVLWTDRRRLPRVVAFAAAVLAPWAAWMAWRIGFYGDLYPNTWWAKSGDLTWWSQGVVFVGLWFARYWALLLGPALLIGAAWLGRRPSAPVVLAAVIWAVYTTWVARVGGGFMYGRLLIPSLPFALIVLDGAIAALAATRTTREIALMTAVCLAALGLSPSPLPEGAGFEGIVDEWEHYAPAEERAELARKAATLRRTFEGLEVTVAFYGTEAGLMYQARIHEAIEAHAGLTDRFTAHQSLESRGRVGHEKHAPPDYLVGKRKAHFAFSPLANQLVDLDGWIPDVRCRLDDVDARVLHWDPAMIAAITKRGAVCDDFLAQLDQALEGPLSAADASRLGHFYFDHVDDPTRKARLDGLTINAPR